MNAQTLSDLQQKLLQIGRETGEEWEVDGVKVQTTFYHNVSRSRDRYLIYMNGRNVGFMDHVVPFSIFKSPYTWIVLEFTAAQMFDFEGCEWTEDFYPEDYDNPGYVPTFPDMENAVAFFKQFMNK
jgi:hypothetical protein